MTDTNANVLVQYLHNSDSSSGTAALRFPDDDRPDLAIGGFGYVTRAELSQALSHGIVLEESDKEEAARHGYLFDSQDEGDELDDASNERLREIAKDEGVDIKGLRSNADIVQAIQERRAGIAEGVESLPATATPGATGQIAGNPSGSASATGGVSAPAGDLGGPAS